MKRTLRAVTIAMLGIFLASASFASAQVLYNQGHVVRVTLLNVFPGHGKAFADDLKQNIVPLWEAEKKAGLILDYQVFVNQTTAGPDDWSIGFSITYKDMAALDGLPDKVYSIRQQLSADDAAWQKRTEKRFENVKVVSSYLLRDVTLR